MLRASVGCAVVLIGLGTAGCTNAPKGSPEGTVKAYYRAANGGDFQAMAKMLAPESMRRFGSVQRAQQHLAYSFDGWDEFDVDVEDVRINSDGKTGTVAFSCTARWLGMDRKYHPATCSDLYSVAEGDDGLWYVILPETQRLRPQL